jgi:hypothetical protein
MTQPFIIPLSVPYDEVNPHFDVDFSSNYHRSDTTTVQDIPYGFKDL